MGLGGCDDAAGEGGATRPPPARMRPAPSRGLRLSAVPEQRPHGGEARWARSYTGGNARIFYGQRQLGHPHREMQHIFDRNSQPGHRRSRQLLQPARRDGCSVHSAAAPPPSPRPPPPGPSSPPTPECGFDIFQPVRYLHRLPRKAVKEIELRCARAESVEILDVMRVMHAPRYGKSFTLEISGH